MEENTPSLFEYNEDTGEIEYTPTETEVTETDSSDVPAADPEVDVTETESEVTEDGTGVTENTGSGNDVSDEVESEEDSSPTQEIMVVNTVDGSVPVTLSDEVTTALLEATTPAGGSLGSTTLDYFDRVVSGLPYDYKYVGYRTNADNSYDGVLYYGRDYDIEDGVITFGKDAKEITVTRVSSSGYSTYTDYSITDAEGAEISLSQDGEVVYYTNAEIGYPVMGGIEQPFSYAPLLVGCLIVAFAITVMEKLILKR